jgi:hypothetical protein
VTDGEAPACSSRPCRTRQGCEALARAAIHRRERLIEQQAERAARYAVRSDTGAIKPDGFRTALKPRVD